jgi:hypothetical protein
LIVKVFYANQYDNYPDSLNIQQEFDITSDSEYEVVIPRDIDLFNTFPLEETYYPPYFRTNLSNVNVGMLNLGK